MSARLGELLDWGATELARASETPKRDAELLLMAATARPRAAIYAQADAQVSAGPETRYRAAIGRRRQGMPVAYLLGSQGFHAIELAVGPDVLVPRPETELIVDIVLEALEVDATASIVDLGTGSGALALAIKQARPRVRMTGVDLSAAALAVARENGRRLGLDIGWIESDWFDALGAARYDYVLCNPPYVPRHDPHMDALRFEPALALDGGLDGLDAIRRVLAVAPQHLEARGVLVLEHGFDQAEAVARSASENGLAVAELHRDLAGHPRVSVLCARP